MRKLLPIFLLLIGTAGGVGAGLALRPSPAPLADGHETAVKESHAESKPAPAQPRDDDHGGMGGLSFVKLNNQFVVPIVSRERVEALVVMSLSIELTDSEAEAIYQREPKLRDQFLQVLFDHANMGGFKGEFTDNRKLDSLRAGLLEVAQHVVGPQVSGVLITDIARQDM